MPEIALSNNYNPDAVKDQKAFIAALGPYRNLVLRKDRQEFEDRLENYWFIRWPLKLQDFEDADFLYHRMGQIKENNQAHDYEGGDFKKTYKPLSWVNEMDEYTPNDEPPTSSAHTREEIHTQYDRNDGPLVKTLLTFQRDVSSIAPTSTTYGSEPPDLMPVETDKDDEDDLEHEEYTYEAIGLGNLGPHPKHKHQ
ncbi:hypothetical protein H0H81_009340 [Sphagnurus paluster]|uniref:Uncharacterized protein n=1 Tax=Sphagnurus paluster TaxID=117069 RepID=A0A9P7GK58_9AGAR|nr:hypothetical protein H0H81_009340 [Sphagnurus paluster]